FGQRTYSTWVPLLLCSIFCVIAVSIAVMDLPSILSEELPQAATETAHTAMARRPVNRVIGLIRRGTLASPAAKAHPQQGHDRRRPVPPGDLLPLVGRPAVVRDRQLVEPQLAGQHLARDLRLDPEVVPAQPEAPHHFA